MYDTDVQDAEFGPAGGAGDSAGQPGLWVLLILSTGEPLAHASQAPHGAAVALLALPLAGILAHLHQLHVGHDLHATNARLQLL